MRVTSARVACTLRSNTWSFSGGSGILTKLTRSRSQLENGNAEMTLARTCNINSKEPLISSGTLGNGKGDLKFQIQFELGKQESGKAHPKYLLKWSYSKGASSVKFSTRSHCLTA